MKRNFDELINLNKDKLKATKSLDEILKKENPRELKRFNENFKKSTTKRLSQENKKKYTIDKINNKQYDINNLKVIGITGTFGKSSVAVILHRYLQSIGKKSVLYSSAYTDSPATWINKSIGYIPGQITEEFMINVLNECKVYEAEYLIFECWDGSIGRGAFDNIKFDLKVLTSFVSNHMDLAYKDKEQYFKLKLKFLTMDDCPVLINMRIEENKENIYKRRAFIDNIKGKKLYYCVTPNCKSDFSDIKPDYYFEPSENLKIDKNLGFYDTIDYGVYNLKAPSKSARIYKTPLTGFNLDNSLCAYAIADFFGELNEDAWAEYIGTENLYVAGRSQIIKWKNRLIIISSNTINLCADAYYKREEAEQYYKKNIVYTANNIELIAPTKINKIIVVASPLRGTVSTTKAIDNFRNNCLLDTMIKQEVSLDKAMPNFTARCYNSYVDSIVLNVVDLGNGDYEKIIEAMKSKLTIPCDAAKGRYEAIMKALLQSEKNDVIIIGGRGNRNINAIDYETIEYGTDLDFIKKACNELYWLE